ncbi:DNA polymerase III subunit delta [Persephonella sp.]
MAEKTAVQLIKKFNVEELKPVSIIYGTEEFLKKQLSEKIKQHTQPIVLWGDETGLKQLKEVFSSSSLFSEGNTAMLYDADSFISKLSKDEVKDFVSFIKGIHLPDRLFIFVKKDRLPAKEPYKTLKEIGDVIVSTPLTPKAFFISVKNKIEKSGKSIDEDTLKYLVERLNNDLYHAKNEIEKLLTYLGDKKDITKKDIDAVVVPKSQENVFAFLDRFFSKDPSALKMYRELISTGHHPFELQSLILNQANKLLLFKTLVEKGKPLESIFSQMNIKHPAVKGSIKKQAAAVSKEELIGLIKQLYSLEISQKVEYMDIEKTAEEFVLKRVAV